MRWNNLHTFQHNTDTYSDTALTKWTDQSLPFLKQNHCIVFYNTQTIKQIKYKKPNFHSYIKLISWSVQHSIKNAQIIPSHLWNKSNASCRSRQCTCVRWSTWRSWSSCSFPRDCRVALMSSWSSCRGCVAASAQTETQSPVMTNETQWHVTVSWNILKKVDD